jgi:hypothetical protein
LVSLRRIWIEHAGLTPINATGGLTCIKVGQKIMADADAGEFPVVD